MLSEERVIYFSINHQTTTSPKEVFFHRVKMTPSGKRNTLQYPIRLAYASTVNKRQGMTLSRCGLVLQSNMYVLPRTLKNSEIMSKLTSSLFDSIQECGVEWKEKNEEQENVKEELEAAKEKDEVRKVEIKKLKAIIKMLEEDGSMDKNIMKKVVKLRNEKKEMAEDLNTKSERIKELEAQSEAQNVQLNEAHTTINKLEVLIFYIDFGIFNLL
uniref:ATP-dependent DNA helicase n=2 Tax=Caenorhabditis tropicalis TaxID=1561998 RepID=A0A1I7TVF3_9PELO